MRHILIDGEPAKNIVQLAIAMDLIWPPDYRPTVDLAEAPGIAAAGFRNGWLSVRSGPTALEAEELARLTQQRVEARKLYRRRWMQSRRAWKREVLRCRAAGLPIPAAPSRVCLG